MAESIFASLREIANRTRRAVGGSISAVAGDLIGRGVPAALATETVRQKSADMLAVGINEAKDDIKENAGPIVRDLNEKFAHGQQPGISETFRENFIKPSDSWLSKIAKKLFFRLIGAGVGIASHVAAGAKIGRASCRERV